MLQNKAGCRRYCKLFGHFSFFLWLLGITSLYGDFEKFHNQAVLTEEVFQTKTDAEFQKEIKQEWKGYTSFSPIRFYQGKKLTEAPHMKQKVPQNIGPLVYINVDQNISEEKLPVFSFNGDTEVEFFGTNLYFPIADKIKNAKFYPFNQEGIAAYYAAIGSANYDEILKEIESIQKLSKLNDWAVYLLVDKLANRIYKNSDEQELFKWFVLRKLNYDVKIALVENHVYGLYHTQQTIYDKPGVEYKGKRYYFFAKEVPFESIVYLHKKEQKTQYKALDLELNTLPILAKNYQTKKIVFSDYTKKYTISFKYNKYMIDFLGTYPTSSFSIYMNAPMEDITYQTLIESLRNIINGMKTNTALNFLLHFVQKGFLYKVDQEQFKRQKNMFAEETLFYKFSDCDDRVTLFGYLIKKLFNIDIYALKYNNHMASALYVPLNGDSLTIHSRRYVLADPTYINANVGIAISSYRGKIPTQFIQFGK